MNARVLVTFGVVFLSPAGIAAAGNMAISAESVSVSDAYVREMPPGMDTTAAYFTLSNKGKQDMTIVGAASPLCNVAEIHATMEKQGMTRMKHHKQVELSAGQSLTFRPGGMHLMLVGLKKRLKAGDQVPITLQLSDGRQLEFEAEVRDMRGMIAGQQH
jgi:hypothetical protein